MAVKENFRNYVGRAGTVGAPKPSVLILGNGPSLAEDLPRLIARGRTHGKGRHGGQLLCAGRAFRDRPSAYYVLSDRCSSATASAGDRVAELYRTLAEKVTCR